MSDEPKAVAELRTLLRALVHKRREIATAAATTHDEQNSGGAGEKSAGCQYGQDLLVVQSHIQAVIEAISHEEKLHPQRNYFEIYPYGED